MGTWNKQATIAPRNQTYVGHNANVKPLSCTATCMPYALFMKCWNVYIKRWFYPQAHINLVGMFSAVRPDQVGLLDPQPAMPQKTCEFQLFWSKCGAAIPSSLMSRNCFSSLAGVGKIVFLTPNRSSRDGSQLFLKLRHQQRRSQWCLILIWKGDLKTTLQWRSKRSKPWYQLPSGIRHITTDGCINLPTRTTPVTTCENSGDHHLRATSKSFVAEALAAKVPYLWDLKAMELSWQLIMSRSIIIQPVQRSISWSCLRLTTCWSWALSMTTGGQFLHSVPDVEA